ncbi:dipeptidase [Alteribacillus iranensis]|uniref:Membrane dipeptidase n=1 Tax=Alteribacillus iranensis TaxID=930128 RepID=A0A1I1ZYY6_9BACI|nr:membrane dipeptidase [Alteribacillus iranensis]SFE36871.1 membrane dipeptidase [Alteribacillus iranensis]
MFTADIHCDALWKMSETGNHSFTENAHTLVNKYSLERGNINVQNFALFTPPRQSIQKQRQQIQEEVHLFENKIIVEDTIEWKPYQRISLTSPANTHAILSLEGAGMFANDWKSWEWLKSKGVEIISLTWNEKNDLAAGSSQPNQYGLTEAGKEMIQWMNANDIIVDASHLNEKSFWDVLDWADQVLVTHSNVKSICNHPRNLSDDQIKALAHKKGFLGLTLYPLFLNGTESATYADIARHLERLDQLGALRITGFGSDFDGIDTYVDGLSGPEHLPHLISWLTHFFDRHIIKGISGHHFKEYWNASRPNK